MKTHQGRRSIDWRVTLAGNPPRARLVQPTAQSLEFAAVTSAMLADPSAATVDSSLRRVVGLARSVIGLERAAVFLLDADDRMMMGTWGTNAEGNTADERDLFYDYGDIDREILARAEQGFAWTVYEDCPLIAQESAQTKVLGRGWVACTPIVGSQGHLGTFFNDTALTHRPVDDAQQGRVALLCSLLGRALEPTRGILFHGNHEQSAPQHPLVREATRLLVADPTLSCAALAEHLGVSTTTLARTFKRKAHTSIVDHRNELRLARFLGRVDARGQNLLEAALEAGFGSYAQFHRVFRARLGTGPREYLQDHEPPRVTVDRGTSRAR